MAPRTIVIFAGFAVRALASSLQADAILSEASVAFEEAMSAEGAACAAGSSVEGCDLHLLQVRAKAVAEVSAEQVDATSLLDMGDEKGDDATESQRPQEERKEVSHPAALVATTGHCSAADAAAMQRLGGGSGPTSFAKAVADCGKSAYRWFKFHEDYMQTCVQRKVGLSAPCAQCFAAAGVHGFQNCKVQCLFGSWCSNLCRGCTGQHDRITQECVGVPVPKPTIC